MFRSTVARSGNECARRKELAGENAALDRLAIQRVRQLAGRFADDATSREQAELQTLVAGSAAARRAYIEAMLLHADLRAILKRPARNNGHEDI
jgi:hypothetical protein